MGVKIRLFEVGAYRSDLCLWGWMKSEVYKEKKRAPSSVLHEAKIAYYARNMFQAARLVFS